MTKVGRFVTDPKAGAYCQIALDSGEKILVSHDKGGFKGGTVTVSQVKWMGLGSGETFFSARLDTAEGRAALDRLERRTGVAAGDRAPLAVLLDCVSGCGSLAELRARCQGPAAGAGSSP